MSVLVSDRIAMSQLLLFLNFKLCSLSLSAASNIMPMMSEGLREKYFANVSVSVSPYL